MRQRGNSDLSSFQSYHINGLTRKILVPGDLCESPYLAKATPLWTARKDSIVAY